MAEEERVAKEHTLLKDVPDWICPHCSRRLPGCWLNQKHLTPRNDSFRERQDCAFVPIKMIEESDTAITKERLAELRESEASWYADGSPYCVASGLYTTPDDVCTECRQYYEKYKKYGETLEPCKLVVDVKKR